MTTLALNSKGQVVNTTTEEEVRFTGKPIVVSTKEDKIVSVTLTEVKPTKQAKAGKDVTLTSKVAKAAVKGAVQTTPTTKKVPEKAAKGVETVKTDKEVKAKAVNKHEGSFAEFMDSIAKAGGTWEAMLTTLQAEATRRGTAKVTMGMIKAHVKFRLSKKADFLGTLQVTEAGIVPIKTAKAAKASKKTK